MTERLMRAVAAFLAARDQWRGRADPAKNYAQVRDDEAKAEAELREAFNERNRTMWTIFKDFRFEAAHSLPHLPPSHKCHALHGHSYQATVYVRGPIDPDTQFVVDYAEISAAWRPLYEQLDHHFLNEVPGLQPSTSENLSKWIYDRMKAAIPGVCRVVVRETATAGAEYTENA